MNLVYNEDNIVIATFSTNVESGSFSSSVFQKMFPSVENLSYCKLDIPSTLSVVGSRVKIVSGIACGLEKNGKLIFEMPKEEFDAIAEKYQQEQKKKRHLRFPCVSKKISTNSFLDRISRLPETYPYISDQIREGSYLDEKVIKVGWWGCFTDAGGYANMNREITRRLHNYYIIPYIRIFNTINQIEAQAVECINMYADLSPKKGDHPYVYAYTPMPHEYHHGKRIFFTMMETSSLHPVFLNHCNKYSDEVWVPSQSNKEVFASCGVKKQIKVVPLGISELLYFSGNCLKKDLPPLIGLYGRGPGDGVAKFKFLTVIQWNFRKGFDALIRSFVNAFSSKDDVCLVIATQYSSDIVKGDLDHFLPRSTDLPQVLLYNQVIPTIEMPGFYRNFDCYVHYSRGEGFSLTQIEAAACGLPVISCFHSGMTEYLTNDNSFMIECNETEKCLPRLAALCFFYQDQFLWKLGEKQVQQGIEHMRYVVNNYNKALVKAEVFQALVKNKYTWARTTERVASLLKT